MLDGFDPTRGPFFFFALSPVMCLAVTKRRKRVLHKQKKKNKQKGNGI